MRKQSTFFAVTILALALLTALYALLDYDLPVSKMSGKAVSAVSFSRDEALNSADNTSYYSWISSSLNITQKSKSVPWSSKWIVATTVNRPTTFIERLAKVAGWAVVVVGDDEASKNWSVMGVQYLSMEDQTRQEYEIANWLPYAVYARKNIGYLYAIEHGAEWIYDTDDDANDHGLILDQFDYSEQMSGLRYNRHPEERSVLSIKGSFWSKVEGKLSTKVFDPYKFFGETEGPLLKPVDKMERSRLVLCQKMRTAAVQQGVMLKDDNNESLPDADIEPMKANRIVAPLVLEQGIFTPLSTRTTLFHRRAFFALFLPVVSTPRQTTIWRSHLVQKLLFLLGENVGVYPVNAYRHKDDLEDFEDLKSERPSDRSSNLSKFLTEWQCKGEVEECLVLLAEDLCKNDFSDNLNKQLMRSWAKDLKKIGYKFPRQRNNTNQYSAIDFGSRDVNCRKVSITSVTQMREAEMSTISVDKQRALSDLSTWCSESTGKDLTDNLSQHYQYKPDYDHNEWLEALKSTALVITSNYPWEGVIGVLQRIYQPYFGITIFCGPWNPLRYRDDGFPKIMHPFNFIHMSTEEIYRGYFAYYCLVKAKELRLRGVKGYFVMADDTTFNFWHKINLSSVFHTAGVYSSQGGVWWNTKYGHNATSSIVELVRSKYKDDIEVQTLWKKVYEYYMLREKEKMTKRRRPQKTAKSAAEFMNTEDGWTVSDLYYIPSSAMDYHTSLMKLFFEGDLFHEIALSKYLRTVPHEKLDGSQFDWLWEQARRDLWYKLYNENLVMIHPIKLSGMCEKKNRTRFCNNVLTAFVRNLYRTSDDDAAVEELPNKR